MQYFSIDYLIVYAFLAITLYMGLRAGRGVKNIRDYAIANKSFGTGALLLSYLAANIASASVLNVAGIVFSDGIIMSVALLGISLCHLSKSFWITPIAKFDHCLTMGDVVKGSYGSLSGIITGILGCATVTCLAGMELLGMGLFCEYLLGIKAMWVIIIVGILVVTYSVNGGIRSVTITDIFQFIILIVVVPFIASMAIHKVGGLKELFLQAPQEKFIVIGHEKFSYYLTLFVMWVIFQMGIVDPTLIQRMLMAKTEKQLRNQFLLAAAFEPWFQLTIMCIGLAGVILYPTLEGIDIVPRMIADFMPIGLKGITVVGMLALAMSSISSYIHTCGLTFVHDIVKPICDQRKVEVNELSWAKYATIALSILAITIGLTSNDIFGLVLDSIAFTEPILLFPLLAAILGLKGDKVAFYIAGGVAVGTLFTGKLLLSDENTFFILPISIITNGIIFFSVHAIRNKGFAVVNREQGTEVVWRPSQKNFLARLGSYKPTLKILVTYSQNKIKAYGAPYVLFGIFFGVNFIFPFFMNSAAENQHFLFISTIRLIGATLCCLLMVREKWSPKLQPYLPNFWHLTILYCLPFYSTIMFLLTSASIEWVINIAVAIILLLMVVDWVTALILGFIGMVIAYSLYRATIGAVPIVLDFTSGYLLVYQGVFGILIGLLFARRKQSRYDQLAVANQMLAATEQETRQAHLETFKEKIRLIKTLKNADIGKLSTAVKELRSLRNQSALSVSSIDKDLQDIEYTVASVALALTRIDHRAMDYLRLEIKPITIEQLLGALQEQLTSTVLHYIKKTEDLQIVSDPIQLVKVLKNTITVLSSHEDGLQKGYYLILEDTLLTYPLPMVSPKGDYIKLIPAIRLIISEKTDQLPTLATNYIPEMGSSALPNPTSGLELLLAENQRIIKAHYGYTNVDITKQTTYDYYLYVVPVDLNDIRPADMNAHDKELGTDLVRANDQYPGAQAQEQAFLAALQQKSFISIEKVKEALELIKWYHGSVSRNSGEPYYLHPLSVAQIVLDWNQEEATIIGALLHDTVEDTPMLLENIDMMFGSEVVRVVDYVTHFESFKDSFYRGKLNDNENKSMLLEATDKRALYLKVADRLHNMRTIEGHKREEKRKKISEETLTFFVPLAGQLGLEKAAKELLEISKRILNR